ncbi:sigma-70 family RNA polymerase sigma factor [Alkalicella caledoniensis]|uniref:Sigma-70 family RNA polymerase sigma factor n=1 Tax=Alkalicella caledoniensis TaxID=2731377 RepID=A0A7G9WBZ1_ALKCA|nr:sigma-70 family RNA polymerase sigma factor [Alkalicella caledoniensis]QNO16203.1 sigma-70 family RNA polymerase sigma factor [Alkalicella caledoniensis]
MWESIRDKITQYPPLSHEEEIELFLQISQGDLKARERFLNHNLRLVAKLVERYKGVYDEEDLFQIGSIGLLKAIDGFDHQHGTKFSTYAVPKILGEIKMYFRDNNPVKLSRQQVTISRLVKDSQEHLTAELGRTPKISEIASKLNVSIEEVVMAMESSRSMTSLEQPMGDDSELTLKDLIADLKFDEYVDNKLLLKEIFSKLDAVEKKIIILRYFQEKSQQQIADLLSINQVQVSRLERKIIEKLKQAYNKV